MLFLVVWCFICEQLFLRWEAKYTLILISKAMPIEHNSVRNRAISKQPFFQNVRTCIKLMRTVVLTYVNSATVCDEALKITHYNISWIPHIKSDG